MSILSTFKTFAFFLWLSFRSVVLFFYSLYIFYISFFDKVGIFLYYGRFYAKEVKAFQSHIGYINILSLFLKLLNLS